MRLTVAALAAAAMAISTLVEAAEPVDIVDGSTSLRAGPVLAGGRGTIPRRGRSARLRRPPQQLRKGRYTLCGLGRSARGSGAGGAVSRQLLLARSRQPVSRA